MRIEYVILYFVNFGNLTCNFCNFNRFIYFSASFYPIWMKIISKLSYNVDLHDYCYKQVRTGLICSVFIGFRKSKNRTYSPVLQRFSPVQFAVLTGPKDRTFKHYKHQSIHQGYHHLRLHCLPQSIAPHVCETRSSISISTASAASSLAASSNTSLVMCRLRLGLKALALAQLSPARAL